MNKFFNRWIKYEQTIDLETNVWGKPFVGALVYQSLLYLKTGLQYGTVLLDCDNPSFEAVFDEMVQDFIDSGHMNKENKERLKRTLLSQHSHHISFSALVRKKSSISLAFSGSRRQSTFNDLLSNSNTSDVVHKKNCYSAVHINEMGMRVKSENKLLSISDANLENECGTPRNESSVNFIEPDNSNHVSGDRYKRRRSTIALIKDQMSQSRHHNKSELNLKGIGNDAEAFVVMVGVVDFLDRPGKFLRMIRSFIL